ncbi:Wzz/FepE/Etk N-terminal domain-containing protein [Gammaproteobacteria bacterium]|nr:Wzz/FepE/Etk N-terminal domain-containing protein [Gammaproteobacteria bacterium]MDA9101830.1 Wzz/FepE/Etk N-terminal domain-containing protein [Gammaproteobacteria bacterium]
MQESDNIKTSTDLDDEINVKELFGVLFHAKWIIVFFITFTSIIGLLYSFYLPDIYKSKALLVSVEVNNSGISGGVGGLAGLAGISVPSIGGEDNSSKAIPKLSSLSFFENNIMPNIFLPDLFAVKSWSSKTNDLVYDENIYNKKSNTWVRDYSYPKKQIPSAQEAYIKFIDEHFSLNENNKTGFITLTIKHQSPYIAKVWLELLVNEVNSFYRQKDKLESEKAVIYLYQQIARTDLSEIKKVIAELLQEKMQKLTLIEVNQSYVFDYIDAPAVMEEKSEPGRALIFLASIFLGAILGIMFVVIKHYFLGKKFLLS